MPRPLTPEQLAEAVRNEDTSLENALIYHLLNNLGIAIESVALYLGLTLALSWANMQRFDEIVDLPSGPATVSEIIERFELRAFLEN